MSFLDWAWVAGILACLAAAAELAARGWLRTFGRYYVWPPEARLHMRTDRKAMPELEPLIRLEFNREGERGGPLPEHWDATYRVLVAGGSVAECWFLDQASSWPGVLERILNEPANLARLRVSRAHVGNIARSLLACEHIDRILERVLPRYERLDVIVLMVGASDLVHWLEQGAPERTDPDVLPLESIFSQHPEGPFGWTPRTLALRRILAAWRRRFLRPVVHRENGGRRIARARDARAHATRFLGEVPDPQPMLDRFEKDLRALIARARARCSRVVLARQPWLEKAFTPEEEKHLWMFGAEPAHSGAVKSYYALPLVWRLMRLVDGRVCNVASDLGVEAVDLRSVVPPTFELWYDEMHHTARGCEEIGRALARTIVDGV